MAQRLYHKDKKLGGLLIEVDPNGGIVFSLGLNTQLTHLSNATDFAQALNIERPDRNTLILAIINILQKLCQSYNSDQFSHYCELWQKRDLLKGRTVAIVAIVLFRTYKQITSLGTS